MLILSPLTWLLLGALIGSLLTYTVGRLNLRVAKILGIGFPTILFVFSALLWLWFNPSQTGFSFLENISWAETIGITFQLGVDGISFPLLLATTLLTMVAAIGSNTLITENISEYYGTLLLLEVGLIGVFISLNLAVFFIFWELVLIPMFVLIGVWGGTNRRYAAMKFLIFTHVGSAIMLLGFIVIYLSVSPHTFDLVTLMQTSLPISVQFIAMTMTFLGFAVKLPVVPLHTWLPDAHVEAPAPISVLLAGVLLKMGGYGFLRINLTLFGEVSIAFSLVFMILAIFTIFYGAFVALIQRDMKRMIALTSINHMGFVLLGTFSGSLIGISGAVFQMFNHACAIGLLFLLSGIIKENAGSRAIDKLSGMGTHMPLTSGLFVFGSFAAMGLPFLSNFVSEFMIITATITIYPLMAIVVLSPGLVSAYFIWTIDRTILSDPLPGASMKRAKGVEIFGAVLLILPIILLGLFPAMMVDRITPACLQLLPTGGP